MFDDFATPVFISIRCNRPIMTVTVALVPKLRILNKSNISRIRTNYIETYSQKLLKVISGNHFRENILIIEFAQLRLTLPTSSTVSLNSSRQLPSTDRVAIAERVAIFE